MDAADGASGGWASDLRQRLDALPDEYRAGLRALAKRYPMSFAAVQKHVAVLEGAAASGLAPATSGLTGIREGLSELRAHDCRAA
jgi:hypothetical protein